MSYCHCHLSCIVIYDFDSDTSEPGLKNIQVNLQRWNIMYSVQKKEKKMEKIR